MKVKITSLAILMIAGTHLNFNVFGQNGDPIIYCSHYAEDIDSNGNPSGVVHVNNLGIVNSPQQCYELVAIDNILKNYSHICNSVVTSSGLGSGPFN